MLKDFQLHMIALIGGKAVEKIPAVDLRLLLALNSAKFCSKVEDHEAETPF